MTKEIQLHGDQVAGSRYVADAEDISLSLKLSQPANKIRFNQREYPNGAFIKVTHINGHEKIYINVPLSKKKKTSTWILMYQAVDDIRFIPYGKLNWIKTPPETLVPEEIPTLRSLIPWSNEWSINEEVELISETTEPVENVKDCGYIVTGQTWGYWPGNQFVYFLFKRSGIRTTKTYSFVIGHYFSVIYKQITESGYKYKVSPTVTFPASTNEETYDPESFVGFSACCGFIKTGVSSIGSLTLHTCPVCGTPDVTGWYGGTTYTEAVEESYINYQNDSYSGFWKFVYEVHVPGTYLDEDNYILWYDYYYQIHRSTGARPSYQSVGSFTDWGWENAYGWVYFPGIQKPARVGPHLKDIPYGIISELSYPGIYPYTGVYAPSSEIYLILYWIGDPYYTETGDSSSTSNYSCPNHPNGSLPYCAGIESKYETHLIGKYQGQEINRTIATATRYSKDGEHNTWPEWSGKICIPWMSRFFNKIYLETIDEFEVPHQEDNHLLALSYNLGTAGGRNSYGIVGPIYSTMDTVNYEVMFGSVSSSAQYPILSYRPDLYGVAFHQLWTDTDGKAWYAWGELYAALEKAKEEV